MVKIITKKTSFLIFKKAFAIKLKRYLEQHYSHVIITITSALIVRDYSKSLVITVT